MQQQPRTPPPRIFPADQRLALRLRKLDQNARSREEAVSQAEAMLAKARSRYEAELAMHIQELRRLAAGLGESSPKPAVLRALKRAAHEVKGQAKIYGYGLVSDLAASICTCFSYPDTEPHRFASAIRAHAEAIDVLYRRRVTGNGNETERAILAVLQGAVMAAKRLTSH